MKVKITLSDGTTVKTEMKTTKKNVLFQYPIGSPIQVLGIYKNIEKVEFPSLKLSKFVLRDIQDKIHELGDYFHSFEEFVDSLEVILTIHSLEIGQIDEISSNIDVINEDGEIIENLRIHFCSTLLPDRIDRELEIIKYNCYMI